MAFEIGQRVTSSWTGPGTVTSEITKDEDRVVHQGVKFDNPTIGEKIWAIKKLTPFEDPAPKKSRKGVASGTQT